MDLKVIPNIKHLESDNFFLIAGPCAIEGEEMALKIAENCLKICDKLKVPYIFKGSYKKANRSRIDSFTGIGDEKALSNTPIAKIPSIILTDFSNLTSYLIVFIISPLI